jgi:hypothetical protein
MQKKERALRESRALCFFQTDLGATCLFLWSFSLLASSSFRASAFFQGPAKIPAVP